MFHDTCIQIGNVTADDKPYVHVSATDKPNRAMGDKPYLAVSQSFTGAGQSFTHRFHLQVCEMHYCLDTPPQIAYSALTTALALISCRHTSHLETSTHAFHKGLTLYTEHAGSDTQSLTQDHTRSQNVLRHSSAMELYDVGYIRRPSSTAPAPP